MSNPFVATLRAAFDPTPEFTITNDGDLPSAYKVTDLAAATIGAAGAAISAYTGVDAPISVDQRLASLWYHWTLRPDGWPMPASWNSVAGDYQTKDGWIRLHTNAAPHRKAALSVLNEKSGVNLGDESDKADVAKAVAAWSAHDLESAVVAANGCAAQMRSPEDWSKHPQGAAVAAEPLIRFETSAGGDAPNAPIDPKRPLKGIRVLDLTRVLAGPVAGRFLAGYGAEVLRIDPPWWDEPGVIPEVSLGKRCAELDLRKPEHCEILKKLMSQCDVFLNGYRADALARLGFGPEERRAMNPGMIDVCLNAYGWIGPWKNRRGFDSLVQMSSGIADFGMTRFQDDKPHPLPVQALDHATGYLMATAAINGLNRRRKTGEATSARLSLSRTARLLVDHGASVNTDTNVAPIAEDDYTHEIEKTGWGDASRLRFPLEIAGTPVHWDYPAGPLRSSPPAFL
ncbi:MAG: CoA transferase [Alphaproteobacteria bacterium]